MSSMRRFLLTYLSPPYLPPYTEHGTPIEVQGVMFSTKRVILEFDPGSDSTGVREFTHIAIMQRYLKHVLGEFGECSIKWLDNEVPA